MGSIFYSMYFLKQPEVQCHHSVTIHTSTPVEVRNCHCLFLLRNENILAHIFLYKALFKAEFPQDSRCTTTGTKYWICEGWKAQAISTRPIFHNQFWFRHYTHNLGGSSGTEIIYTVSTQHTTKRSAVKKLSRKIPHTLGRKRAAKHSTHVSLWAMAMKLFLSGADGEESWPGSVFSEKPRQEKAQHQADHSRAPRQHHLQTGPHLATGKYRAKRDTTPSGLLITYKCPCGHLYITHYIEK